MPFYDFRCETCGRHEELCCSFSQLGRFHPKCCDQPMGRDYQAEHFGGIAHRSKGVYPIIENLGDGDMEITSHDHHRRELSKRHLDWSQQSAESKYRRKHVRDRG